MIFCFFVVHWFFVFAFFGFFGTLVLNYCGLWTSCGTLSGGMFFKTRRTQGAVFRPHPNPKP